MNKTGMIVFSSIVVLVVLGIMIFGTYISYSNKEIMLRNQIVAKQQDNQNEFDNMWKKISQVAQVTDKERQSLMDIFIKYADARTNDSTNQIMTWVKESVPNVNSTTYQNLQNIIVSSRDSWTMRQKELIDYKREHDNLRMMFPGSLFLTGRPEIKIIIVTSSKTQETFKTGNDDNVDVFGKGEQ
jgi:hypothetical protein